MTDNTPGWQPDPSGAHEHRYWDGTQWTDNVADAGVAGTDPYDPLLAATTPDAPDADATVVDTPAVADTPAAPDDTAAWPTAPSAPAPPPPYVPTSPATAEGGGSKKGLLVGGGILAAVVIAVVAFLAFGGGDDNDGELRTDLAAMFKEQGGLSQSQASCMADFYVDDLGAGAFKGIDLSDPDADPPKALEDEFLATGFKAAEECKVDQFSGETTTTDSPSSTSGGGGEGTYGSDSALDALYDSCADGEYDACDDLYLQSPSGSEYEDFGDTCGDRNEPQGYCVDLYENGGPSSTDGASGLTPDFEKILADTYEQTFNLSRPKAECLAAALATAIEDGTMSETQAMSNVMSYLSDCDISLEEISGN